MDEEAIFNFDTSGWVVLRGVLSLAEVAAALVHEKRKRIPSADQSAGHIVNYQHSGWPTPPWLASWLARARPTVV